MDPKKKSDKSSLKPLILKRTRHAGGWRFWIETIDGEIVAHVSDHKMGDTYANLLVASYDLYRVCEMVLKLTDLDPSIKIEILTAIMRARSLGEYPAH